tara:strand:- start:1830 stop:3311 length:1482 start_codon:yes stop_codon:yes gene_type:complete
LNAALDIQYEDAPALLTRAVSAHAGGDKKSALDAYNNVILLDPKNIVALTNLGTLAFERKDYQAAIDFHEMALAVEPNYFPAIHNLGAALNGAQRYDEALVAYRTAIELSPDDYRTLSNLGETLTLMSEYGDAIDNLRRAVWSKPEFAEAHCNLGMALMESGFVEKAIGCFRVAIALNPTLSMAHKNLGIALLSSGQFYEGWPEYGWRFEADEIGLPFDYPVWDGESLDGKLLVWLEQGIGDEILQAGMLGTLIEAGHKVVCVAEGRLITLLARAHPELELVARSAASETDIKGIKAQIPGGSLGFYTRRSLDAFPARSSYLTPDKARADALRIQLDLQVGERLVGVSWASLSTKIGDRKSIDLSEWDYILNTGDVRYVDLQYGDTEAERHGVPLVHVDGLDLTDDMEGLAALISLCDGVVTVSNSVAHLAGALGIPAWVLMPPDGLRLWWSGLNETPFWYPNTRIIRKSPTESWGPCLEMAHGLIQETCREK